MGNRIAIVTGGSSGIGKCCVEELEVRGYEVIGLDIKGAASYLVDISSSSSVKLFVSSLKAKKIDLLVNNAAIQVEKKLIETEEDEWDSVINTNLKSVFLLSKHLAPLMNKDSSIVNISSIHSRVTSIGLASYVASKGGVSALTRAMALELAEYGIRVNSILPGAIDTPMLDKGLGRNASYDESKNKLIQATPVGRLGQPKDIANLVCFLADSNLSGNITGQEFLCDGGVSAKLASE